mgnify:CR=1 FL=1
MPDYMYEGLPNPDLMPTKLMISNMPENLDKPPAEDFDAILKQLYKEKLIADRGKSRSKGKRLTTITREK